MATERSAAFSAAESIRSGREGAPAACELPASAAEGPYGSERYRNYVLGVLVLAFTLNFIDRALIGVLNEPIREEFGLDDFRMGLLGGFAFALLYTLLGLPIARLSENYDRRKVIALSIATWSVMTALCGLAGKLNAGTHALLFALILMPMALLFLRRRMWAGFSLIVAAIIGGVLLLPLLAQYGALAFGLLLITRIGVGIGEAGCAPPANSLIADYFPPHRRATALGIFSIGVPLGACLSALGGGWLTEHLGWRNAFVWIGLPGALVALVVLCTVREPPRVAAANGGLRTVFRLLMSRSTFRNVTAGAAVASFVGYGAGHFLFAYFSRSHQLSPSEAALFFVAVAGLAAGAGSFLGGYLSDRLAARWPTAYGVLPGLGLVLSAPLYALAFRAESPLLTVALLMPAAMLHYLFMGPMFAMTHGLVGPRMRATAVAILALIVNLVGYGLGPPVVGMLSDLLAARAFAGPGDFAAACSEAAAVAAQCRAARAAGLQHALTITVAAYAWAGVHFMLAGRTFHRESVS